MVPKPNVPPFRMLSKLIALKEEKEKIEQKIAAIEEKKAKIDGHDSDIEEELENAKKLVDLDKNKIISEFDYPVDELTKEHIVNYNEKDITLYEIFDEYGTT